MTGHPTDGVDEITTVKIFKTVLIGIMGVGLTMKVKRGRVFNPVLIMSILQKHLVHMMKIWNKHLHDTLPR